MDELQWRLNVYAPSGAYLRTIMRDETAVGGRGFRMSLTPNGDCREMTFEARGSKKGPRGIEDKPNWGLTSLQAIQFEYLNSGVYVPLFYAQIRIGGNQQDLNGETYTLRSLILRLKYITLPDGFKTPQQPAHLTVRTALQAVIASGQLGTPSLIVYDESLIPDLGFDCREVANGNRQDPYALLEQIQQDGAGFGVTVVFGVRPDRKFFCQVAKTDTLTLSESETRRTVWKAPVAETPCTSVLWFLGKRSDGSPLTYQSYRMPDDPYGIWVTKQPINAGTQGFAVGAFEAVANDGDGSGDVPVTYGRVPLIDGFADTTRLVISSDTDDRNVYLRQTLTQNALRYEFQAIWVDGDATRNRVEIVTPDWTKIYTSSELNCQAFATTNSVTPTNPKPTMLYDLPAGTVITFYGFSDPTADPDYRRVQIFFDEARPDAANATLLDQLAQSFYVLPASDPADIELPNFRTPAELAGRVQVGSYNRAVDAWEYRLSSTDGLIVAAQTGQADDPRIKAQADLIKARDGQAVITSITART